MGDDFNYSGVDNYLSNYYTNPNQGAAQANALSIPSTPMGGYPSGQGNGSRASNPFQSAPAVSMNIPAVATPMPFMSQGSQLRADQMGAAATMPPMPPPLNAPPPTPPPSNPFAMTVGGGIGNGGGMNNQLGSPPNVVPYSVPGASGLSGANQPSPDLGTWFGQLGQNINNAVGQGLSALSGDVKQAAGGLVALVNPPNSNPSAGGTTTQQQQQPTTVTPEMFAKVPTTPQVAQLRQDVFNKFGFTPQAQAVIGQVPVALGSGSTAQGGGTTFAKGVSDYGGTAYGVRLMSPQYEGALHEFAHVWWFNGNINQRGFEQAFQQEANDPNPQYAQTVNFVRDYLQNGLHQSPTEHYASYASFSMGDIQDMPPMLRPFYAGLFTGSRDASLPSGMGKGRMIGAFQWMGNNPIPYQTRAP